MDNKKSILWVDATPNIEYPLRILQAYRKNCDFLYTSISDLTSNGESELATVLNDAQKNRAIWLDWAIEILKQQIEERNG
jgi:hypothetical protein